MREKKTRIRVNRRSKIAFLENWPISKIPEWLLLIFIYKWSNIFSSWLLLILLFGIVNRFDFEIFTLMSHCMQFDFRPRTMNTFNLLNYETRSNKMSDVRECKKKKQACTHSCITPSKLIHHPTFEAVFSLHLWVRPFHSNMEYIHFSSYELVQNLIKTSVGHIKYNV